MPLIKNGNIFQSWHITITNKKNCQIVFEIILLLKTKPNRPVLAMIVTNKSNKLELDKYNFPATAEDVHILNMNSTIIKNKKKKKYVFQIFIVSYSGTTAVLA